MEAAPTEKENEALSAFRQFQQSFTTLPRLRAMPVYDDWKAANAAQRYAEVKRAASGARDPEDVKREHDAMVEAMMAEMSPPFPRPKPTLKMTPQDPFFRGSKVVQGFQALAAAGNPEYLSEEWHSAPKLYVTAWGRAYGQPPCTCSAPLASGVHVKAC